MIPARARRARRALRLIRDRNLVDEHGHAWTAARLAGEMVVITTLLGVPFFFWSLIA